MWHPSTQKKLAQGLFIYYTEIALRCRYINISLLQVIAASLHCKLKINLTLMRHRSAVKSHECAVRQLVVALLPRWLEIAELHGVLLLASNWVYNVKRMSRRRSVPIWWIDQHIRSFDAHTMCFCVGNPLFPDMKAYRLEIFYSCANQAT